MNFKVLIYHGLGKDSELEKKFEVEADGFISALNNIKKVKKDQLIEIQRIDMKEELQRWISDGQT